MNKIIAAITNIEYLRGNILSIDTKKDLWEVECDKKVYQMSIDEIISLRKFT